MIPELPYPPFSGPAYCPKCGDALGVEYRPAGTKYDQWVEFRGMVVMDNAAPEWILRQCVGCDFTRPEMCADAFPHTALTGEGLE